MDQGKKGRRDEPAPNLCRIIVRLRVVAVDLGNTVRCCMALEKLMAATDGKANVAQSALVGPARRIADDYRKNVEPDMIVVGPPNGAVEEIAAVAAPKIEDDRRRAAKEGRVIERSFGQTFEGRLGPL